jgi:hypothetical protein
MNRTWIDFEDAVGLTIEHVAMSNDDSEVLIALSGNKFATIEAEGEYGEDEWVQLDCLKGNRFYPHVYKVEDLEKVFDEVTNAIWAKDRHNRTEEARRLQEQEDRAAYERLRKQFEGQKV